MASPLLPPDWKNPEAVARFYESVVRHNAWGEALGLWRSAEPTVRAEAAWNAYSLLADAFVRLGQPETAATAIDEALARHRGVGRERLLVQKAAVCYHLKDYETGIALCDQAIHLAPNFLLGSIQKGALLLALGRFSEAELIYRRLVKELPRDYMCRYNYASSLLYGGKRDRARNELEKLDASRPETYRLWAVWASHPDARASQEKTPEAWLEEGISVAPHFLPNWVSLAEHYAEALDLAALEGLLARFRAQLPHAHATELQIQRAKVLAALGREQDALGLLEQLGQEHPASRNVLVAYVKLLLNLGQWDRAEALLARAQRDPNADWRLLELIGDFAARKFLHAAAIGALKAALAKNPRSAPLALKLARLELSYGNKSEGLARFALAARLSNLDEQKIKRAAEVEAIFARLQDNDWSRHDEDRRALQALATPDSEMGAGVPLLFLYAVPGLTPEQQIAITNRAAAPIVLRTRRLRSVHPDLAAPYPPRRRGPIKVGFASMDFRKHAVTYLIAELFERIDRRRFELFAYSYGPDDGSAERARVSHAVDHFVDIAHLNDLQAARRIRQDSLDLFIDLAGHTRWARLDLPALKPAPVVAHALGYVMPLGRDVVDYNFVDPFAVPPALWDRLLTECPAYLPCLYPSDTSQPVGQALARAELGLPDDRFVFACFSNAYKINPPLVDAWARILAATDGVLWLWDSNAKVVTVVRERLKASGIDPSRVIPAAGWPLQRHYQRIQAADLSLDTTPYGSGTTANISLWAGVPLLGIRGSTLSARGSASQLMATGLEELICDTLERYVERAVHFATHPEELQSIRAGLSARVRARDATVLFNMDLYAQAFADLCEQMVERHAAGLAPAPLAVRFAWQPERHHTAYREAVEQLSSAYPS